MPPLCVPGALLVPEVWNARSTISTSGGSRCVVCLVTSSTAQSRRGRAGPGWGRSRRSYGEGAPRELLHEQGSSRAAARRPRRPSRRRHTRSRPSEALRVDSDLSYKKDTFHAEYIYIGRARACVPAPRPSNASARRVCGVRVNTDDRPGPRRVEGRRPAEKNTRTPSRRPPAHTNPFRARAPRLRRPGAGRPPATV